MNRLILYNADSSHYYERFWNLQNDEFTLWREGYIDDKTYEGWLAARHDEYHRTYALTEKSK
jgi:hypothetical protein